MKKAFTFTELMLVMSIIGVLMAIMIPILNKVTPDETTINYRKTFFAIEDGVKTIINDNKLYPTGDLRYIAPPPASTEPVIAVPNPDKPTETINVIQDTTGKYLCKNLANVLNTSGVINCPGKTGFTSLILKNSDSSNYLDLTLDKTNFIVTNGVAIGGIHGDWDTTNDDTTTATTPFITLCIDVNGFGETGGVNRGCNPANRGEKARDQFRIRLAHNGKIYTDTPIGPNNWYMENLMLINPSSLEKKTLSEAEITEVTKGISTRDNTDNPTMFDTKTKCENKSGLGYTWITAASKCVYTAGYTKAQLKIID